MQNSSFRKLPTNKLSDGNDESYVMWKKVNSTVASWILNTLSKELRETFDYTESDKELWDSICSRYGESNGPTKYKLKREVWNITQGNASVVEFF